MAPTSQLFILIRAVGAVAFGNVVSKLIMFFANIIIANRLLQHGFGQLSFAFTIVNYLSLVCFSGIDTLTTRRAAHCDLAELNQLANELFCIRTFLCLLLCAFISLAAYLIGGNIGLLLFLYGLSFIPQTVYSVNLFYAREWSLPIMLYFIGGRIVYLSLLLWGVNCSDDLFFVPVAFALSIVVENLFLLVVWVRKFRPTSFSFKFNFGKWKDALPLTTSSAFLLLHENAGLILLAIILGSSATGLYNASYRLVFIAISLSSLLSYVFLARLSKIHKTHNYRHFIFMSFILVALGGLSMAVCGSLFAGKIIALIYVDAYAPSASILFIAVWQMALAPLRILSFQTLNAFHLQNKALPFIVFASLISLAINWWLILKIGINGAAIGTVIGEALLTILMIILVLFLKKPAPAKL